MAHNGYRIIEARRRLEERQRDIEASMAQERRAIRMADFEINTSLKIEQRAAKVVEVLMLSYPDDYAP